MIVLNFYSVNRDRLLESISMDKKPVSNLDEARFLVVNHLGNKYKNIRYVVSIEFLGDSSTIDVVFESDPFLNRTYSLDKLV